MIKNLNLEPIEIPKDFHHHDQNYFKLLSKAIKKKLNIICYDCKFLPKGIKLNKKIKIIKSNRGYIYDDICKAARPFINKKKSYSSSSDLLIENKNKINNQRETPWGTMTYLEYKKKIEFGKKEFDEIDKFCKKLNIIWFASPWDIPSNNFLNKYVSVEFL